MTVDRDLMLALEAQSAIALSETEREAMQAQLQRAIDSFGPLNALNTAGVEPLIHVRPLANVMREDRVAASMDNELLLGNAARVRDGAFLVYRAVE